MGFAGKTSVFATGWDIDGMESETDVNEVEAEIDQHVAAVELLPTFRELARGLCPKDKHLQEDLIQEMALATLQCATPKSATAYCVVGLWRAKNYLRLWIEQSKRPGCEVNSHSVEDPEKKAEEAELAAAAAEKAERAVKELQKAG